jgi:hypothetical protein
MTPIRLDKEISAIRQRVRLGTERDRIHIETLTAATVDSLRVELLWNSYDVIHFAGHADADGLSPPRDRCRCRFLVAAAPWSGLCQYRARKPSGAL